MAEPRLDKETERPGDKRRGSWIKHLLLLAGGGFFGACVAIGLQLMWQLTCRPDPVVGGDSSCSTFVVTLMPTLFGALFGGIAADLIWTRRR